MDKISSGSVDRSLRESANSSDFNRRISEPQTTEKHLGKRQNASGG